MRLGTKLKQGTGDFDEDSMTSEQKLDIIVEFWNVRDEMKRIPGEDDIKVVVSKRWKI